ncbi:MAG TPA: ribulose-phosphate 3-epimerase, partial [Dermatophilaceae bacterium]|nr:ribulose-phosphate 3-epimerase [Dermatophilaceae bacterium]
VEAAADPRRLARTLRALGARASMALKPGTPWTPYEDLLPDLDMVLVMTVEPGFGGQSFMADQMPKVRQVRESVRRHGGQIWVQVDGGVSATTIEQCAEAGADVFVAGSAVYGAQDAAAAVDELRALVSRHHC